jgi:predicted TPR repeat methyltransferase
MCDDLEYCAPAVLDKAIDAALDGRRDLAVLELGCGTGLAGRLLRPRARRLVGIDLSEEMLAHAAATGAYDELDVAEITAWLARTGQPRFDLVVACDTLIYFGDLRQVIVPAARLLAPGGWIAFTAERDDVYPFHLTDSGRYAHHPDHIREVATEAGLTVRQIDAADLRFEYGEPVAGVVVVLQK